MAARRRIPSEQATQEDDYPSKSCSPVEKSAPPSKLTALVLTVPGIVIYTYILYTMVSKLVYPGSFSPFASTPKPPQYIDRNTTGGMAIWYRIACGTCM